MVQSKQVEKRTLMFVLYLLIYQ